MCRNVVKGMGQLTCLLIMLQSRGGSSLQNYREWGVISVSVPKAGLRREVEKFK